MGQFSGKTILITGGTGSFGNALLQRLSSEDYKEIRIFSRDELKQEEMRVRLADPRIKFFIGDVRDRTGVDTAMEGVDCVFHAAALKQVPSCEFFPVQAVMTNVLGSSNVISSAIEHGVSRVVCLSTDKAVSPVNAMGMTKGLMEKVALAAARGAGAGQSVISCVRYGNVMCSRGSVIPLFMKQIREKAPITVTSSEMTRFLLPLREAIELVVYAFGHAEPGDILVRKAPACTVGDLATALKNIAGSDVAVKAIGVRHGEKIHETLATREELHRAQDLDGYYRIKMDDRDLNYDKYFTQGDRIVGAQQDYTSENTRRLTARETQDLLLTLPEVREGLAVAVAGRQATR